MNKHKVYIIVAVEKNFGIGKEGGIPWHFKKEMKFFKETTTKTADPDKQNIVIMGRTTWESLTPKFKPLANRKNIVLTTNPDYKAHGAEICDSLSKAIDSADDSIETIFIIGGTSVYNEAIKNSKTDGIYITKLDAPYDCDTFFPQIPEEFKKHTSLGKDEEDGVNFEYLLYEK
ncbi:MAG: dihydrofolate reductase [Candidatus Peregrinibacteria bacterium]